MMTTSQALILSATLLLGTSAASAEPTTRPAAGEVVRIAGEVAAPEPVDARGNDGPETHWQSGDALVRTPLPEGYPPPTPPGAVELKAYPSVRQAVAETRGMMGGQALFFPLFRHIQQREIAMTAPVVMTGREAGQGEAASSMAFLYRSRDLGPTGEAGPIVKVEDTEPGLYLAIGLQGPDGRLAIDAARKRLGEAFDAHLRDAGWRLADRPARLLGYNGPMMPAPRRWWELQVAVEPAE